MFLFFINCLVSAASQPPASQEPVTVARLEEVCGVLLENDRKDIEENKLKYSPLTSILGPLRQILESVTSPTEVPFKDLLARFVNTNVATHVELLTEAGCILEAKTFVDFFLRGKIPVPVPAAVDSGIGAHGGAIGRGRLPFFIHDLFHASEMVKRVMPYQQYLKPLFESILAVTPDDKKPQVYYLLAMYIHEVAPDHNIYKDVTSPQQVLDAFFRHLQERLVTKLSRECEEERTAGQSEDRSQQGNHGGHFAKELAQCAWVYETAARNCGHAASFSWTQFMNEVKQLSGMSCNVEPITGCEANENFVRVNGSWVETLSPKQMERVNLADPFRDLKGLALIPEGVEFDAMPSGTLQKAFATLINNVVGWSRLIPQPSAGPQELPEIATLIHDLEHHSIFPIGGCAVQERRQDQRNVQLRAHSEFLCLTEAARETIRKFVATQNDRCYYWVWHDEYLCQMVQCFIDPVAGQFRALYESAINVNAYLASRFAHVYLELRLSQQSADLTLGDLRILHDRLAGEIDHELHNSQSAPNAEKLRCFQESLRAPVRC